MILAGYFCCPPPGVHWNDWGELPRAAYQLEKRGRVWFAPIQHQAPFLLLLDFPVEHICAGTPTTIKELKKRQCQRTRLPFFTNIRKGHCRCRRASAAGGSLAQRAKMGPFTVSTADTQPRLGMTDDIVNLLCHFIIWAIEWYLILSIWCLEVKIFNKTWVHLWPGHPVEVYGRV